MTEPIHDNSAGFEETRARRRSKRLAGDLGWKAIMLSSSSKRREVGEIRRILTPEEMKAIDANDITQARRLGD